MEKSFDYHINGLFKELGKIAKRELTSDLSKVASEQVIEMRRGLDKYVKCYNATAKDEKLHQGYFKEIYDEHSKSIGDGHANDYWLKNKESNIVVVFAKGQQNCTGRVKIQLSTIYQRALTLAEEATKIHGPEHDDCALPLIIMLKLYRVFRASISDEASKKRLSECILSLEQELGISREAENSNQSSAFNMSALTPLISNIGAMFNQFLQNPAIQKTITDLRSAKDPNEIIAKATGMINDPNIGKAVNGAMQSVGIPIPPGKTPPATIKEAVTDMAAEVAKSVSDDKDKDKDKEKEKTQNPIDLSVVPATTTIPPASSATNASGALDLNALFSAVSSMVTGSMVAPENKERKGPSFTE